MSVEEIMAELETLGSPSIKKVLANHGAREPFFGVKVEHLKAIQKRIKTDYSLALGLYATGNSDAMYLAGLIADDAAMTRDDLQLWVEGAYWPLLSESTVPWVTSGSPSGREMAIEWIESSVESIASAGWCTLSSIASVTGDDKLNIDELRSLLDRVAGSIHSQPNRVRSAMNGFVIAVGTYVAPLTQHALECAARVGAVHVDTGGTACKVADAKEYIARASAQGKLGKKRKTAKC